VSIAHTNGGTVDKTGQYSVPAGARLTIEVIADAGYRLREITRNGVAVNLSSNRRFFTFNIDGDMSIFVSFEIDPTYVPPKPPPACDNPYCYCNICEDPDCDCANPPSSGGNGGDGDQKGNDKDKGGKNFIGVGSGMAFFIIGFAGIAGLCYVAFVKFRNNIKRDD
jgi:hypothetical protein